MIYVDDPRSHDDFLGKSTDLYIYDIPKTLNQTEIETILKSVSKVKSYQYKRLHKYQLIRVELFLCREFEKCSLSNWTTQLNGRIFNLRYVLSYIKKSKVIENRKHNAMIKIPSYKGQYDNLDEIVEYLKAKH